ncbi:MAG: hypothetical protein QY309_13180 [Cyclobacteriaceae bacterium]|nr:MAG: hypothetical protein QY309_13180 [Cyclobacteriaceae bacterium]
MSALAFRDAPLLRPPKPATAQTQTLAVIFSMKNQLLILGLWTLLSCTTKSDTQTFTQADTLNNDINVEQTEVKTIDSVLYKSETLHYFSSTTDKDSFKIVVTGQSLKNGQFRFQVITKDGQVILNESYETTMLLDYGLKANSTDSEIEDYIKTRIDKFFNADNFHQPAISKTDTFDEDYGDKEIWDDIISDQTSIGFYYLIGEEDGRQIAFSKKKGKVVLYYNCC